MIIIRLTFFLSVLLLSSCENANSESDHAQIIQEYFAALNNSNYGKAADLLSDGFTLYEFDIEQVKGKEDWHRQFQWDSVFSPTYEIIELNEVDDQVEVTVSKICDRIRFLHDEAIVYKNSFEFDEDKISSEKTYENIIFDESKWQSRRDTLVVWIDKNHPGLSGFVYNQTIKGGQDYLKAIELYGSEK